MLVENHYPQDIRVRNEATLLASHGYDVSVICVAKAGQSRSETVGNVRVYRVPRVELFKKTSAEDKGFAQRAFLRVKSLMGYLVEYFYFTSACFIVSACIFVRRGFDVIHAHNPPDTLFLAGLPFRLLGVKYVFDHHDLCPELYMSRYGAKEGILTRGLHIVEWCSLKLATVTIATNESYRQVHITRGNKKPESIFIVRNGPNEQRMARAEPSPRLRAKNQCILAYIGCLNPQDGLDYLLRSLHKLRYTLNRDDFYCVIMGTGDSLEDLRDLSADLKLGQHVELPGFVSEEDLRTNLAAADICVDPDPSSPLNDVSTWIKVMEYMAYAKPIVTFDLKETRFSAQSAAIYVPPNDEFAFAQAICKLMDSPAMRRELGEFGRKRVESDLQWSVVSGKLLDAYRFLLPAQESKVAKGRSPQGVVET
ncbi:MAG TPA: glycosyltransferase family 4 protein [Candidatus Sulfotelmatobacter sp.]|nr:glycosyltransferase family 4 protein [Candidatus Sulfotelmatobacter sp.]